MFSSTLSTHGPTLVGGRSPRALRRAAAGTLMLLLAGCSSMDWVTSRFVEPAAAPAAAPSSAAAGTPAAAPAPAPAAASSAQAPAESSTYRRRLRDAPPNAKAAPPPAPAAAVVPPPPHRLRPSWRPPAAVAAPVAAAPAPAAPVALPPAVAAIPPAPPASAAEPLTAPVPPRAVVDLAPGRYAVQVAAFMTPASAEAQRSRTATALRAAALPEADATRVLKLNDRYFVLVGDVADRAQADALAAQVRAAVRHDVVIFRR
ncbi:MAG: SPOR domain-containing protein [Burkholderiaceae bacterium]|nr:SPOR domain-containing protein [Burkholderiaceae bacterium]